MTKKIDDIDINVQNSKKNINEKNLSIKKRKSSKKIVIDKTNYEEIYFTDFVYEDESCSLYCSLLIDQCFLWFHDEHVGNGRDALFATFEA